MPSLLFFAPLVLLAPAALLAARLDAKEQPARAKFAWGLAAAAVLLAWAGIVLPFPILLSGPPRGSGAALVAVGIVTLAAALAVLGTRPLRDVRLLLALAAVALLLALLPQTRGAGFALAAAAWPRAALVAPTPRATLIMSGASAAGAVVSAVLLVVSSGAGALAHQSWTLQISPSDGADYTLTFPFLVRDDGRTDDMLQRLRDGLHVAEGDATLRLLENGTILEVQGHGGARIESTISFVRESGDALSFVHDVVADASLVETGTPTMRLTWSVDLSSGTSGTCHALDERNFTLQAGTIAGFSGGAATFGTTRLRITC